jgi:hypothetical protein
LVNSQYKKVVAISIQVAITFNVRPGEPPEKYNLGRLVPAEFRATAAEIRG